jgi:hypothetical protein
MARLRSALDLDLRRSASPFHRAPWFVSREKAAAARLALVRGTLRREGVARG